MSQPPNENSEPARLTDTERRIEESLDCGEAATGVTELQNRIDDSLRRTFAPKTAPRDLIEDLRQGGGFQARLDDSLRRSFASTAVPRDLMQRLRQADQEPSEQGQPQRGQLRQDQAEQVTLPPEPATVAAKRQRLPNWAVAAVLLLGVGSWLFSARELLSPQPTGYPRETAVAMYQAAVQSGFEPDWFCEDEKRFAETFAERQGQGVWLRPLPEGTRMAGLAYRQGFAKRATCLLAWSGDQPVLVMVAKASTVDPEQLKAASGVRIHTQELGDLLIVEASLFDMPLVTPALYLRDPPAEPTGRVPGAR